LWGFQRSDTKSSKPKFQSLILPYIQIHTTFLWIFVFDYHHLPKKKKKRSKVVQLHIGKMSNLDAYKKPPEDLKNIFKKYQKFNQAELENDNYLIDFSSSTAAKSNDALSLLQNISKSENHNLSSSARSEIHSSIKQVYEHPTLPGSYKFRCKIFFQTLRKPPPYVLKTSLFLL
jgi:hypothetical protein